MRRVSALALLVALLLGAGSPALARKGKKAVAPPPPRVADHERDTAINRGLRYLDKTVFSLPDSAGTPQKQFTVAVSGVAWLLARGSGRLRTDGHAKQLARVLSYLEHYIGEVERRTATPAQLPEQSGRFNTNHIMQYTWPVAMAGIFHGELHARGLHRDKAKKSLARIVRILEAAQRPNGGWGHGQVRNNGKPRGTSVMDGFGGYPDTLLASSNLVAASLGLVRKITPPKDEQTFDRARDYFEYAELSSGNFPYDPSQRSAHMDLTGVSRAAGAAFALHTLDADWDDIGLARALEFVDDHFEYLSEGHGSSTHNLLLCALLQRVRSEKAWQRFKTVYFRRLLQGQQKDGSFLCICQNKAFGSTNDSKPLGGKSAGSLGPFAKSRAAYISSIHTVILLLDQSPPHLLGPRPKPSSGSAPKPTTPR